jgi:hypothetical protein
MATTVAMTHYSAQKTLNFWLNGGATSVTQAAARPYIYLMLTTPTDDIGTGYTPVTGVTYTPVILSSMTVGPPGTPADFQRAFNPAAISMTISGGSTSPCTGILLCLNNSATPSLSNANSQNDFNYYTSLIVNPVIYYGTFLSPITLNNGDTLTFALNTSSGGAGITVDQY